MLLLCFFVGIFAYVGTPEVDPHFSYYFLVRDCEDTTAGAVSGESYASGGAGYYWAEENAVVLACYFREADATFVADTMSESGVSVRIVSAQTEPFSVGNAAFSDRIAANAKTLDSIARILFDAANGLERLEISQEEAHVRIASAADALSGLAKDNRGAEFDLWNAELLHAAGRLKGLEGELLFPKDLRYVQVMLTFCTLRQGAYFS